MKYYHHIKKVVNLTLIIVTVALASPMILGKIGFYGNSYAAAAVAPATPVSSLNLNAPVSYADAVALASPSVVSIKTTKEIAIEQNPLYQDPFFRYFFGEPGQVDPRESLPGTPPHPHVVPKETLQGLGSGVIVNNKGYILTNYHVVKDVDTVVITLSDGRTADGKVVGSDPDTDLAVLKIKLDNLPVIPMGSSTKLRAGDVVLAIGNPFGLEKTVTQGIVSATERAGADIGVLENLIQTDAAINPGNSGGALIDTFGHMVGINTAIYTRSGGNQGIGFAIPIDTATDVMEKLIKGERIIRGYLGIMMQPLTKEIRDSVNYKEPDGVYVRAVVRGSPAQKAGIIPGDIILKINNITIKDERLALGLVASLKPNQQYPIEIFRKGDFLAFTVTAGERKTPQVTKKENSLEE